jgi:hypothetical protein
MGLPIASLQATPTAFQRVRQFSAAALMMLMLRRCCVAPTQGQAEAATSVLDHIARASSSDATATRRLVGSSTASS